MKAVLVPIQPKWCEKIAHGEKTIEVRKNKPKLETPFKCYIYCTSVKSLPLEEYVALHASTGGLCDKWSGKVIGEFICDKIDEYVYETEWDIKVDIDDDTLLLIMLTRAEINEYAHGKTLYGWHIHNLKIYDKPKELIEFERPCSNLDEYEGEVYCDCNSCEFAGDSDYGVIACDRRITRPPQSWCYVEEQ